MSEFCPKCYHPLETSEDVDRLCVICNWFGDKSEVLDKPPPPSNLELAFIQMLSLYRDICRLELMAEQLTTQNTKYTSKLKEVRIRVKSAEQSLIHLFRNTREAK